MTDDFWDTTVCRHVCALSLLRKKFVFFLKASDLQECLTVVNNDMVSDFHLLGKVRVFNTDELVIADDLLFAVEQVLLASLDLVERLASFKITQAYPGSLQVDINAAFFASNFRSFPHHLNQNLVLLVLNLRRIDPTDVHSVA